MLGGSPKSDPWTQLVRLLKARIGRKVLYVRRGLPRRWLLTHPNCIKRLPAPDRALLNSAVRGVKQTVEVLLKRGANANLTMLYGVPLIAYCAYTGRTDSVRALLDADARSDAASPVFGLTALHFAPYKGNLALIRLLIDRGANIEGRTKSGATPLIVAARNGQAEAVSLLLVSGALVDVAENRLTPLAFAAMYGHTGVVRALIEFGADPSVRTKRGLTALDQARRKAHWEISRRWSRKRSDSWPT
jgi:ankyrin repeat protein